MFTRLKSIPHNPSNEYVSLNLTFKFSSTCHVSLKLFSDVITLLFCKSLVVLCSTLSVLCFRATVTGGVKTAMVVGRGYFLNDDLQFFFLTCHNDNLACECHFVFVGAPAI